MFQHRQIGSMEVLGDLPHAGIEGRAALFPNRDVSPSQLDARLKPVTSSDQEKALFIASVLHGNRRFQPNLRDRLLQTIHDFAIQGSPNAVPDLDIGWVKRVTNQSGK